MIAISHRRLVQGVALSSSTGQKDRPIDASKAILEAGEDFLGSEGDSDGDSSDNLLFVADSLLGYDSGREVSSNSGFSNSSNDESEQFHAENPEDILSTAMALEECFATKDGSFSECVRGKFSWS